MSDKAKEFEDFILDDYDFNKLEDWDLEHLWDYVDFDDFSDIGEDGYPGGQGAPGGGAPGGGYAPPQQQSQAPPPGADFGTQPGSGGGNFASQPPPSQPSAPPPSPQSSSGGSPSAPPPSDYGDGGGDPAPSFTGEPGASPAQADFAPPSGAALDGMPQALRPGGNGGGPPPQAPPGFSFDDEEDDAFSPPPSSQQAASPPSFTPPPRPPQSAPENNPAFAGDMPTDDDDSIDDYDFAFDYNDFDDEDGFNFNDDGDFNFDDEGEDEEYPQDFMPSRPQSSAPAPSAPLPDYDFDDIDDYDFEDEAYDDDEGDDDEGEDDEAGDDTGYFDDEEDEDYGDEDYGYDYDDNDYHYDDNDYDDAPYNPNARVVQTSAGEIDLDNDNLLEKLQQLDFNEFIEILQNNPVVFDEVIRQGNWSEEELSFLHSLMPTIRDKDTMSAVAKSGTVSQTPPSPEPASAPEKEKAPIRNFENPDDLYESLRKSTLDSLSGDSFKPKLTVRTEDAPKRKRRRGGDEQKTLSPREMRRTIKKEKVTVGAVSGRIQQERDKLLDILVEEIENVAEDLTVEEYDYIMADSERFGFEFCDYLFRKYGSEILFLFQGQLKLTGAGAKFADAFKEITEYYFEPEDAVLFVTEFLKGAIKLTEENGLAV